MLMGNPHTHRVYAQDLNTNLEELQLLAQGILWIAQAEGEADRVSVGLGEDPEKGPYIEYDLHKAPNTRGVIQAMKVSRQQGHNIITKENQDGTMTVTIPLNEGFVKG